MQVKFLIMAATITVACGEESKWTEVSHGRVCESDTERKQLVEATLACIKVGNPMSDEEGEDLVEQCEATMVRTVFPERRVMIYRRGTGYEYDRRVLP